VREQIEGQVQENSTLRAHATLCIIMNRNAISLTDIIGCDRLKLS